MNCSDIHDILFAADSVDPGALPAEVESHVANCDACVALRQKLQRLTAATLDLAPAPGADAARRTFLRQLAAWTTLGTDASAAPVTTTSTRWWRTNGGRVRPPYVVSRYWRPLAAAAAIVLPVGLTIWLVRPKAPIGTVATNIQSTTTNPEQSQLADSVVDKLVDVNLALADADSPQEREQIFANEFTPLQKTLQQDQLAPDESELAGKLVENGVWLSSDPDPIAQTERFDKVASMLLDRLQNAAPAGNNKQIARLSHRYAQVAAHLEAERQTASSKGLSLEKQRRYANLLARQNELDQRLQALLKSTPEPSRKQIRQEIETARKSHKKHHRKDHVR